eukprot:TRINITY_DN6482_c0_g1_i1.p1 TRINITY_DN6482_c0_g1~~TRINITY_DN6482_c0_g1_i1.p1  ORF type:complete len:231 (+),score=41.10 TRINITY_DN6482_c0_g1_i1:92-784(+)
MSLFIVSFFFFFFNDTATTEIYTLHIVGSVRCVQETDANTDFTFSFLKQNIKDPESDTLTFTLLFFDFSIKQYIILPQWLSFDENLLQIKGNPPSKYANKKIQLKLIVSDTYFSVYQTLNIKIKIGINFLLQFANSIFGSLSALLAIYNFRWKIYEIFWKDHFQLKYKIILHPGQPFQINFPLLQLELNQADKIIQNVLSQLKKQGKFLTKFLTSSYCLLYTSPSPRDQA